ncbi:MAG: hypothetical protein FWF38_00415 [Spirochaetaceae bacterium]|nr:hypothetical protein [Spirochaetaceae bacterium]
MDKVVSKVLPVSCNCADTVSYKINENDVEIVKAFYKEHNAKLKDGRYLKLTIELWERKRTLAQNNLWHEILRKISQKTYQDIELVKQGVKDVAMQEYGYTAVINPITGKDAPKPSRLATVKEMAILFDVTFIEGANCGVDLSEFMENMKEWKEKNAS